MRTALVTHADCLRHDMGAQHPEQPARLTAIDDQLIASGIGQHLQRYDAPLATDEQLTRVHPREYVRAIREIAPSEGTVHLDPDTAMNAWTLQAALRAAGAGVMATDLVLKKEVKSAFCPVRPPGHHACRARAMGFCIFNNAAVTKTWLPALEDFRPQLVLFSAGFDAHVEDDMAMLRFTDGDYGWITEQVKQVADRYADGRMVSLLEGGYALGALGRSAVQHIRVLAGLNS